MAHPPFRTILSLLVVVCSCCAAVASPSIQPSHRYSVQITADGTRAARAIEGRVELWDLNRGTRVRVLPNAQDVALAPDGRHLVWSSNRGEYVLSTWEGEALARWQGRGNDLALIANGRVITFSLTGGGSVLASASEWTLAARDYSGKVLWSRPIRGGMMTARAEGAIASDGTVAVVASNDIGTFVVDVASGESRTVSPQAVPTTSWGRNAIAWIASGLLHVATKTATTQQIALPKRVSSVTASADGRLYAVAAGDSVVVFAAKNGHVTGRASVGRVRPVVGFDARGAFILPLSMKRTRI